MSDKEKRISELELRKKKYIKEYTEFNSHYENRISMLDIEIIASNELYKFLTTKYEEKINLESDIKNIEHDFKKEFIEKYLNNFYMGFMDREKIKFIKKHAEFKAEDGSIRLNLVYISFI